MAIKWTHTRNVLNEYAYQLNLLYLRKLEQSDTVASTKLYDSVKTNVSINVYIFEVTIELEDYWKYVEYGRRKGAKQPPPEAMDKWIKQKPITHDARITDKQLGYLIGRSISKKGIKPKNFLSNTNDEVFSMLQIKIIDAITLDLTEFLLDAATITQLLLNIQKL